MALRLKAHRNEKRTTRKCRWLASLKRKGKEPFYILLETATSENWEAREQYWIATLRAEEFNLTNHTAGGDGVIGLDAESKAKLSKAAKERMADPAFKAKIFTAERAAKISAALTGRPKTKEHIAKLPQNQPGHVMPESGKRKISQALLGNKYRLGIPHKAETKARIKEAAMGNSSRTGMRNTEEHNRRISEFQKGRPKTEETKAKMAVAKKLWWERKRNAQLLEQDSKINGHSSAIPTS